MVEHDHVHNINFVTPDHFFPHLFRLTHLLRRDGFDLPLVYNLSGYQSPASLKSAQDYVDIYLPDFKYSDASLAARLSQCGNYPRIALEAIAEMVSQKGFLDSSFTGGFAATRGVLVRHLVLPGKVVNSIHALTALFVEFGPNLPLSLMTQYHPVVQNRDEDLNRTLSEDEFDRVYLHAQELGFEHLFVQFPDKGRDQHRALSPFLPDFERPDPFPGAGHAKAETGVRNENWR
jgi:putative pyruvate formate lyase activating enzyme